MVRGQKVVVVLPAFNAEKTLFRTVAEIDRTIVDEILLVDDFSKDQTLQIAVSLNLPTFSHDRNHGYGACQKTCYREALARGADIVVMVHPDYQYSPKLVGPMATLVALQEFDVVLGSRLIGNVTAISAGMPLYKYLSNRMLTMIQNLVFRQSLSEYHTGLRAFSANVLRQLPLENCSDDFVFDNQILAQIRYFGFRVGEVSCPARYFEEASSINFWHSVRYGLGCLQVTMGYILAKMGLVKSRIFTPLKTEDEMTSLSRQA